MTHRHLFRHPVGRMPGPARWYLASLAMLALLLTAAHFAVQAHIQRTMRAAVERLLVRHGGGAASGYHLLRGALTLRDIHLRQNAASLRIGRATLQVSAHAMGSGTPDITLARLDDVRITLPASALTRESIDRDNMPQAWLKALMHADIVQVRRGVLQFNGQAKGDHAAGWRVHDINGEIRPCTFRFSARGATGHVAIDGRCSDEGWQGDLRLQRLPAVWLTRALKLNDAPRGALIGGLRWRTTDAGLRLNGDMRLDGRARATAHLQADIAGDTAQAHIVARDWPLAGWTSAWPAILGRAPKAGNWSGDIEITHGAKGWRMHVSHGKARDLVLGGNALPDWHIDLVEIEGGDLDWSKRRADLARGHIRGARLSMLPTARPRPPSPWHWRIGRLEMEDVQPELRWPGASDGSPHRFALPPMHGRLTLTDDGRMHWRTESDGNEGWTLEGQGRVAALDMRIVARQASLAALRPLLPKISLIGEQGPVHVRGEARLDLRLQQYADRWSLRGEAVLANVMLAQGGDVFRAGTMRIPLEQVDIPRAPATPPATEASHAEGRTLVRALGDVRVRQWSYQAALHPIPRSMQASPSPVMWPDGLNAAWRLRSLVFEEGRISIGHADAIWADHAWIRIGRLTPGKRARFKARARLGGGMFRATGWLSPHARPWRLRLLARLNDALPFFLNDWLAASGAPRLIRGRLSASLDIRPHGKRAWKAALALTLKHGATEAGAFPDDPLATLTGLDLQTLLARFGAKREATVRLRLAGDWAGRPPALSRLGRALVSNMRARAAAMPHHQATQPPQRVILAGMRLYRGRVFTHNERVRLRKVIRRLHTHPRLIVELVPRLGAHEPDAELGRRVRRTQSRIERYMRARGVKPDRIYPIWPTLEHRGGDTTGIDIVALQP